MIEEELRRAAAELRDELQAVTPPPFKPRPQLGGRVLLVAATAAVVVIGFTLFASVDDGQDNDPADTPTPDVNVSDADSDPDGEQDQNDVQSERPVPGPAITDITHRPATDMERPGQGRYVLEPEFATIIAGVTAGESGAVITPIPNGAPSWNADGSLVVLYETGTLAGIHAIYDGTNFERIGALPFEPLDIEQLHWDPSRPNRLYFVEGNVLQAFDIESVNPLAGTQTAIALPEPCTGELSTQLAHKPISADGQMMGLTCEGADSIDWIALNLETGETSRAAATGRQAPIPTADGDRFVVASEEGLISVLDATLQPTGISFQAETSEFYVIRTDDGRDIAVTTIFSLDDELVGAVIGFDLATGDAIPAVGLATDYPYPPSGVALSTSIAADGMVTVSIFGVANPSGQDTLDGELLLVDFNTGNTPTVYRLGHHRSPDEDGTFDRYRSTAWTALSPDGSQMLFASHWGEDTVDTFVIDIANLRDS